MEAKKEFGGTGTGAGGTSFSQLLFGDDDHLHHHSLPHPLDDPTFNLSHSPLFSDTHNNNTPKILCFGNHHNQDDHLLFTSTHSSSADSPSNASHSFPTNSNSLQKKRNGSGEAESVRKTTGVGRQRQQPKKTRTENSSNSTGHAKRKEKLGERIAALQQLVSPFGKTDTASVLHEATGYIRFLHDQVQVLCSPYLQRLPSSCQIQHQNQPLPGDEDDNGDEVTKDLKSRGLCLIPVGCTLHVASTNGADFWSSASVPNNHIASPSHNQ